MPHASSYASDMDTCICSTSCPTFATAPWTTGAPGLDLEAVQRSWREDAEERLAGITAQWVIDPRSIPTAVTCGMPAAEIVRDAAEQGADAIVLGSHGHGLVRRFMLGSVADRVIRHARCPVLVVPHRALRWAPIEAVAAVVAWKGSLVPGRAERGILHCP
jgi:nucleotide-binding universal stress UspA family protein